MNNQIEDLKKQVEELKIKIRDAWDNWDEKGVIELNSEKIRIEWQIRKIENKDFK